MPVASMHFRALIRECATPREYCASESPDRHAAKHGYLGICTRRLIPVEVAEFLPQCARDRARRRDTCICDIPSRSAIWVSSCS
jgi:hypothetical protein